MISKGKRKYLLELYQPDGFFYRDDLLCYRLGKLVLVDLVVTKPVGVDVCTRPVAYDIEFDVLSKDNVLGVFTPGKVSQWGQWSEQLSTMTQSGRHDMAFHHPDNFQYEIQNELIKLAAVRTPH